jgi:hypothetical protein
MGYGSISGHAITNPSAPSAFGRCDSCGFIFNLKDLKFQHDWRGRSLQNLYTLRCRKCLDKPNEQLRVIVIPPDPMPVANARPDYYCQYEVDDRVTSNPALPPVDFATSAQIQLSGLQFIGGIQVQSGELVLRTAFCICSSSEFISVLYMQRGA